MQKYLDDVLILLGCGLIVYATSLLSKIAAIYTAGVLLIGMGILIGISMRRIKMIISNLFRGSIKNAVTTGPYSLPEVLDLMNVSSTSGQNVTPERSKNISTAYRCINVLGDDVAKMPLQAFVSRSEGMIERVKPSSRMQNIAWLLEISPNRWMTPFVFKKTLMQWLICWGNAYAWMPVQPPGIRREIFILPSSHTMPMFDTDGNYGTRPLSGMGKREISPMWRWCIW